MSSVLCYGMAPIISCDVILSLLIGRSLESIWSCTEGVLNQLANIQKHPPSSMRKPICSWLNHELWKQMENSSLSQYKSRPPKSHLGHSAAYVKDRTGVAKWKEGSVSASGVTAVPRWALPGWWADKVPEAIEPHWATMYAKLAFYQGHLHGAGVSICEMRSFSWSSSDQWCASSIPHCNQRIQVWRQVICFYTAWLVLCITISQEMTNLFFLIFSLTCTHTYRPTHRNGTFPIACSS